MEYLLLLIIVVLSLATCICDNVNVAILKHSYGSTGEYHRYVNDRDPNTCFRTNPATGTYTLSVDLADNFRISSIVIIDGNSCCGTRLVNYTIQVKFSCKFLGLLSFTPCDHVCTTNFWSIPDNENHLISCDRCLGHTVVIKSNEPLVLCEVEIYGSHIADYPSDYKSDPAGGCVVTNAIDPSQPPATTTTSLPVETTSYVTSTTAATTSSTDETTTADDSLLTDTQETTHHPTSTVGPTTGSSSTEVNTETVTSEETIDPIKTADSTDTTSPYTTSTQSPEGTTRTTTDKYDNQTPLKQPHTHGSISTLPQKSTTIPTNFARSSEESKTSTLATDVSTKDRKPSSTGNWSSTHPLMYTNSTSSPKFNNSMWNPVTDPSLPNYTYDMPNLLCACGCQSIYANISEIDVILSRIRQNLTLNTATLSSTRRQKTSAEDNRPSAVSVGMFGVVILTVFFVVLVIQDFITAVYFLVTHIRTAIRRVKPI